MAFKGTSGDVEIDIEGLSSNDELNFQDIAPGQISQPGPEDDDEVDHDTAELLGKKKGSPAFWSMEYYQQFFDIDTTQVLSRLLGSVIPNPRKNFLQSYIRPTPDLYGPFWICVTLVFSNAVAGNMAQYFVSKGTSEWVYDFHKVTLAATVVFSYWWVVPSLLYAVLWFRGSRSSLTYLELICLYGYSMAVYVPLALLWTIPLSWLQWLLVAVGGGLSGSVLVITLWPVFKQDNSKVAAGLSLVVFVLHLLLAVVFMMYFFHNSAPATYNPVPQTSTTTQILLPKLPQDHEPEKMITAMPKKAEHLNSQETPETKAEKALAADINTRKAPPSPASKTLAPLESNIVGDINSNPRPVKSSTDGKGIPANQIEGVAGEETKPAENKPVEAA